jgi:hypothetical protein
MYITSHRIGGYDQTIETFQIRIREGDRHVSSCNTFLAFISRVTDAGLVFGLLCRYAYFKKLTYFSTECIYSPDGTCHWYIPQSLIGSSTRIRIPLLPMVSGFSDLILSPRFLPLPHSLPRPRQGLPQRSGSHPAFRYY